MWGRLRLTMMNFTGRHRERLNHVPRCGRQWVLLAILRFLVPPTAAALRSDFRHEKQRSSCQAAISLSFLLPRLCRQLLKSFATKVQTVLRLRKISRAIFHSVLSSSTVLCQWFEGSGSRFENVWRNCWLPQLGRWTFLFLLSIECTPLWSRW